MADLKLKNGTAQEETYTGITAIRVPKVGGGYAEFKEGGASQGRGLLTNTVRMLSTEPNYFFNFFQLTGSPMTVTLYFDVPKGTPVAGVNLYGGVRLLKEGGNGIQDYIIADGNATVPVPTELNETTTRYCTQMTLEYDNGETVGAPQYVLAVYQYAYEGVSEAYENGEFILSGENAAKFMCSTLFKYDTTQEFHVYDLREDTMSNIAFPLFRNINACKRVYFPAGVISLPNFSFFKTPNIELLDFSLATAVPTLGSDSFGYCNDTYQIKVPAALYDSWISATNWSKVADHIVAV